MERTIRKLFSEPFGQGYPKGEAARKLKDTALLKEIRARSQTDAVSFLDSLDRQMAERIMTKRDVTEYILENGTNEALKDWIRRQG